MMLLTIIGSLGFTTVYADEIISVSLDLQTILLDEDEIIPLNTNNIGNMSSATISATLPCNSSNIPNLKIIGGILGNTTSIIESSVDYVSLRGPFDTCLFEDTLDVSNSTIPALNRIFLTNDGTASVLTNLGTTVTVTGIIPQNQTSESTSSPISNPMNITNNVGGTAFPTGEYDNNRQGVYVANTESDLYNVEVDSVSFWLKKQGDGGCTTATVNVWSNAASGNNVTLEHTFGSVSTSSINATNYEKVKFAVGSYVLSSGDTLGLECNGLASDVNSDNHIIMDGTNTNVYDSTDTQRQRFTSGDWDPVFNHDIRFEIITK